jgi:hypothetical protein
MTPKVKAAELVNKYYQYFESNTNAKECALITVDEILLMVEQTLKGFLDGDIVLYWLQVKQEIYKI